MQTLITKHLAGLFNGISEQAPTLRLETQAQNQVNGWSSLVYGLTSRPPTRFIKELAFVGDSHSIYHSINRDSDEKYIIGLHKGGTINVYGLDGTSYPVDGLAEHKDYLNVSIPKNDIAMTTIADYTFIVNKTKKVEMELVNDSVSTANPAQCKITLTALNKSIYTIKVDGATIASVEGVVIKPKSEGDNENEQKSREQILKELRDAVNGFTGFSATYVTGDSFTFRRISGGAFSPSTTGSLKAEYTAHSTTTLFYDTTAYIYVAKGVAEQNYQVSIDNVVVAAYTSGNTNNAGTYKTDVVASNLFSQIVSKGFSAELTGSVIKVWKKDGSDFSLATHDSWGEAALKGFKGRAQAFSELPARCFNGAVLQIAGKTDSDEGSYWVRYETSYVRDGETIQTTGVWKESREPNKLHKFKASTMPIQLVRKQDRTKYVTPDNPNGIYFSLEFSLWSERLVGDENSAPAPSFVGRSINDIFLFSNRLGILAGQSICLTKVGDFFNFFPTTVTDALDDEPIDVDAPSLSVTNLYHAIPSRDNLMIFSDDQQFILNSGNDPLTTKTVNVTSILQYPCDGRVAPIALGQMAYYITPRGKNIGVREYFIQSDGMVSDAPNITDHVPTLMKYSNISPYMCGVANEDMLFIADGSSTLYVYKFAWSGDTKAQSSWSKWEFNRNVISLFEFDNDLYIIFDDKSLEKIVFIKDTSRKYADSFRLVKAGSPVVAKGEARIYDNNGSFIESLKDTTKSYPQDVRVGYPYKFIYEFSPLFLKLSNSSIGTVSGKTLLRNVLIYLEGETSFDLKVNDIKQNKTRITYHYTTPAGKAEQYEKSFLLRGEAKDSTLEIVSTGDKPVILQSASFDVLTSLLSKPI